MKKKKKNNLKRSVFQVVSVGMALMMPMTSIAGTATPSEIQQYDSKTSEWGASATESSTDDTLNDHSENTYDGKIHLFFDTTGGQWLDPSQDGTDGPKTNAHNNGTYVITIPTKISYENMNIGRVDTSDTYDVNIRGAIGQNEKVKLTAETEKTLVNGDKSGITEATHMGEDANAAVYGERIFDSSQVYGGLNNDGSLSGTTVQDTITMKGEVTTAGVYEGSVQYNAELVKDSTTEKPDTQTAAKKYMQYLTPGKNVTKNGDTFLATPGNSSAAYLTLDTSSYVKSDQYAGITNTEITVNDTGIATAEANKDENNNNSYDFFIKPVADGETVATIKVTFLDGSVGTAVVNVVVKNQADTLVEKSAQLVTGQTFNKDMQSLATGLYNVNKIAKITTEPTADFIDISLAQNKSAKMTYDSSTGTINLWTSADKFKLNKDSSWMFSNCYGLTSLDLSSFNTANVTDMNNMFYNCSKLTSLDLSSFNTASVTDMHSMFNSCSGLTNLDVSNFNTKNVTNMSYMFKGCSKLTSLDVSKFNTANVTNMSYMFKGCSKLTSLDVSNFDTANVTSMGGMFSGCSKLTNLDVSKFNTAKVTNMSWMFYNCSKLTNLDVSKFNTANVTDMSDMFHGCSGLTNLDVSKFNTANVTDMSDMFNSCYGLTNLDLSNFDTTNVTNMSSMFSCCSGLTSLDVSNFDTANVMSMSNMFDSCSGLTVLYGDNFDTSKAGTYDGVTYQKKTA